jgi:hypothetical protein
VIDDLGIDRSQETKETHPQINPFCVLAPKLSTPSTYESLHARSRREPRFPLLPCISRGLLALYRNATATAAALGVCVILIGAVPIPLKCAELVLLRHDPVIFSCRWQCWCYQYGGSSRPVATQSSPISAEIRPPRSS